SKSILKWDRSQREAAGATQLPVHSKISHPRPRVLGFEDTITHLRLGVPVRESMLLLLRPHTYGIITDRRGRVCGTTAFVIRWLALIAASAAWGDRWVAASTPASALSSTCGSWP